MKFSCPQRNMACVACCKWPKKGHKETMTLFELSQKEDLTPAYVAKIMGILRKGGLVQSLRGQSGGYQLLRSPAEINVGNEVLEAFGREVLFPRGILLDSFGRPSGLHPHNGLRFKVPLDRIVFFP